MVNYIEATTPSVLENVVLQPPPAPRKVYVRKMISVSTAVRRKLNFDDFEDDGPVIKKLKFGGSATAVSELLQRSSPVRSFQPIHVASTPSTVSRNENNEPGDVEVVGLTTPRRPARINLAELFNKHEKEEDENTLKVDAIAFTTPDKCVCTKSAHRSSAPLNAIKPSVVHGSRIKGPLRF